MDKCHPGWVEVMIRPVWVKAEKGKLVEARRCCELVMAKQEWKIEQETDAGGEVVVAAVADNPRRFSAWVSLQPWLGM